MNNHGSNIKNNNNPIDSKNNIMGEQTTTSTAYFLNIGKRPSNIKAYPFPLLEHYGLKD